MNIQLSGAEEWIDQKMTSVLGQVLIRYVLQVSVVESTIEGWQGKEKQYSYGVRMRLIGLLADATTSYGSKARTRIMAIQK